VGLTLKNSTSRKKLREVKNIPVIIRCEDSSVSPEKFDFLTEMMKRIDPDPYSWDDMYVYVAKYPSLDPYLEVDRTTMPTTRPCMGSITIHVQRLDGKQAHFSIADFWDTKELHHNLEYWWKDFEGNNGADKKVKGHRKFDIKEDIYVELDFCDESLRISFRGCRPNEKIKPKKKRSSLRES